MSWSRIFLFLWEHATLTLCSPLLRIDVWERSEHHLLHNIMQDNEEDSPSSFRRLRNEYNVPESMCIRCLHILVAPTIEALHRLEDKHRCLGTPSV